MCQIQIFVFWELDWRKYVAVNFFTLFPTHIWVKINLTCWWHTLKSKGQGETSWFLSWTAGGEILVYYLVVHTVWTEIKVNSYISTLKPLPFFSDCVLFPQLVLSRKMSFYIVTYYLPSGLFVVVSWISFLVNPEVIVESFLDCAFPFHPGDPRSDDSSHHHLSRPHQYIQHHPNQLTSGFTFLINFWFWFAYISVNQTCQCFVWKKSFLSTGGSKSRHVWRRWPWPTIFWCQ